MKKIISLIQAIDFYDTNTEDTFQNENDYEDKPGKQRCSNSCTQNISQAEITLIMKKDYNT